jgi:hypothetical protein
MSLSRVELHIFTKAEPARLDYHIDDHATRRYLRGYYNTAAIEARIAGDRATVRIAESGRLPLGSVAFAPVFYGAALRSVAVNDRARRLKAARRWWVGAEVAVRA